jgi:hypothetical protein
VVSWLSNEIGAVALWHRRKMFLLPILASSGVQLQKVLTIKL